LKFKLKYQISVVAIAINCKNTHGCRGKFAALNLLPLFNVYLEITPHRYCGQVWFGKPGKFLLSVALRKGLWTIKISKICHQQNSIFINFENPAKNVFIRFCLFLFYNVFKEKMFTIEIEDGCEAP